MQIRTRSLIKQFRLKKIRRQVIICLKAIIMPTAASINNKTKLLFSVDPGRDAQYWAAVAVTTSDSPPGRMSHSTGCVCRIHPLPLANL